ncbi:MAG: hypothetical protein Q9223_001011 [Gallowayella weberi]
MHSRSTVGGGHETRIALGLESVIGSTVVSVNALSAAVDTNTFAFCAGATVVLAAINSHSRLDQRFFSASPEALPSQATPSYYNPATPTKAAGSRVHTATPSKDEPISGLASFDTNGDALGKVKPSHRSRSFTSIALSPSGRFLAVGEMGYHPRILVFSTAPGTSQDAPLACLTEHTFGIRAITFSPDSRWLCSLGDVHDGGLFLWSINSKTGALRLDSSNRCTTAETIAWMGTNVVTLGTRHVKVWRVEQPSSPVKARRGLDTMNDHLPNASPGPRTFAGRNVLLGSLKDAVFTCAVGISEDKAILCTQDGVVCLLDDADRTQRLFPISKKDYSINCVTYDRTSGVIWIGGKGEQPESLPWAFFSAKDPSAALHEYNGPHLQDERNGKEVPGVSAICCVDDRLITIDSRRSMSIFDLTSVSNGAREIPAIKQLPAHESAILGVVVIPRSITRLFDFLTYSEKGQVLYWSWDGICTGSCFVPLDHPLGPDADESNELRVVRYSPTTNSLVTGDKAGVLRLLNISGLVEAVARAHDGEMYDLTLHDLDERDSLAASCGRDRTIQIFRISTKECFLEQSLINEHAGPIRKVQFAENGSILASMSSDRTIVFHRKVLRTDNSIAFVSTSIINLKACPTSMSLFPGVTSCLVVSAMDRCVRKISIGEGNITHTFKTFDTANGESVTLSRLTMGTLDQQFSGMNVLAGFSSADGLIRLYDVEMGSLLAVVQGQSTVSDLALAQVSDSNENTTTRLISTGFDGTIMLWKLTRSSQDEAQHMPGDEIKGIDPSKLKATPSLRLVRRVLSKAEIAGFQRLLKEKNETDTGLPRNLSPSRLRRQHSRHAVSDASQVSELTTSTDKRSQDLSARSNTYRQRIKHTSPPISPRISLRSRSRRSSLDERHRRTAINNTSDANSTARQISNALQHFRKVMANSGDSLSTFSTQGLQRELQATLDMITPRAQRGHQKNDQTGSESFDDHLAKMIDERLALRAKSEDQTNATEGSQDTSRSQAEE